MLKFDVWSVLVVFNMWLICFKVFLRNVDKLLPMKCRIQFSSCKYSVIRNVHKQFYFTTIGLKRKELMNVSKSFAEEFRFFKFIKIFFYRILPFICKNDTIAIDTFKNCTTILFIKRIIYCILNLRI